MIVEYYGQFRIADMYSLLLFIFILATLVNWLMKTLFARLSPSVRAGQDAGMYF
jgi:ABC-type nitrate/sulfonate/bicarbonate transport system permease component